MEKIRDYEIYNIGMRKSIRDKLFWEGLIDDNITGICDFGCADGQLLATIHKDFPEWNLYGVDNDPRMRDLATTNVESAQIISDLTEMILKNNFSSQILNISSTIHEIYSYCSDKEISSFWRSVFGIGFRYIAIRDFMPSKNINGVADINDYQKILAKGSTDQISDFENIWGSMRDRKNMIHFLMKYRYTVNWDREVRENYFPITIEDMLAMIPDDYRIVYSNHYILPFTYDKVLEDFGIEIKQNTHVKLLIKRK